MKKLIFRGLLFTYILLLLSFIYVHSDLGGLEGLSYIEKIIKCSNLIPFCNFGPPKSLLISFIIYIPITLLSRDSFEILNTRKGFYLFIMLLIIFIELVQVLTLHGYFDINDIIFGFIGTVFVYELFGILISRIENRTILNIQ